MQRSTRRVVCCWHQQFYLPQLFCERCSARFDVQHLDTNCDETLFVDLTVLKYGSSQCLNCSWAILLKRDISYATYATLQHQALLNKTVQFAQQKQPLLINVNDAQITTTLQPTGTLASIAHTITLFIQNTKQRPTSLCFLLLARYVPNVAKRSI